jgi:imidazole glycerol-phosphate synthase subunit HisH
MISIIDYGMGNLNSVQKALELALYLEKINKKIIITSDKTKINQSSAVILPGVGAFGEAMKNLKNLNLIEFIQDLVINKQKLFLGICLGYQLLFEKSYELGEFNGLGLIKGEVIKFNENLMKVPHIGWNTVEFPEKQQIFNKIQNNSYFYFVHSFFIEEAKSINNKKINTFTTEYGNKKFISGIQSENIYGFQFHPEKSQNNGIQLLKNFVKNIL